MSIPTPHNEAKKGDFAPTVLMPGDPLRAKFIAETFLEDPVLVNGVRGVNGFTGAYKGKRVSVMASGMGIPAIGIYSYELYNFYGVENIIRIGSAGTISDRLNLRDIVIALGACTDSNFAAQYGLPGAFAPTASYGLVKKAAQEAERLGVRCAVGNVLSSDVFYADVSNLKKWSGMGVLAVEMESAGLYMTAAQAGKNALCLCTISDNPFTGEGCTAKERQLSFKTMMEIALEIA